MEQLPAHTLSYSFSSVGILAEEFATELLAVFVPSSHSCLPVVSQTPEQSGNNFRELSHLILFYTSLKSGIVGFSDIKRKEAVRFRKIYVDMEYIYCHCKAKLYFFINTILKKEKNCNAGECPNTICFRTLGSWDLLSALCDSVIPYSLSFYILHIILI
jgi:hypothetical protein